MFALSALALAQTAPAYEPIASVKQIMSVSMKPLMDSLGAMNKAGGPQDDKQWGIAEQTAAMLAETGHLLLEGNRAKDQDVWVKNSQKLQASAVDLMKAAHDKNADGWKASMASLGGTCRNCHNVHRKRPEAAPKP